MYNRKKELIKSGLIIGFILLIAVVSTHYIYYKYENESDVVTKSDTLDIVYHEKTANMITINKVTPVADSVGLSSKAYTFTVANNTDKDIAYKINIIDDLDAVIEDGCEENLIDKKYLRISIKENGAENKIYTLDQLTNQELLETTINSGDSNKYSIRIWADKDLTIPTGSNLHYHGLIKIDEE